MAFAVGLTLDEESSLVISGLWHDLADRGVSSSMLALDYEPHITLGISDTLELENFRRYLEHFSTHHRRFPLLLSSLGVFPAESKSAVFLGVTVNHNLLHMHEEFHRTFAEYADGIRQYYLPTQWVPHCTLADGLPCESITTAMEICSHVPLPILCHATGVSVLEFPPGNEIMSFTLREP